jgi:cytochrome c2
LILALALGAGLLSACGSGAPGPADAARGQALFLGKVRFANSAPACGGCHAVEPGAAGGVGPNLSNVGNRAATRIAGMSAEAYLRQSIVEPDAYLAPGYQEGIHPRTYGRDLTSQQLADLIAYLETLKSGQDR